MGMFAVAANVERGCVFDRGGGVPQEPTARAAEASRTEPRPDLAAELVSRAHVLLKLAATF